MNKEKVSTDRESQIKEEREDFVLNGDGRTAEDMLRQALNTPSPPKDKPKKAARTKKNSVGTART